MNPSQENTVPESAVEQVTPEPVFTFPPISGFWRRLLAWLIDVLILGVIGQIIGIVFSSFLFSIGPYGRPIGLLFTIPYFGIMNSKIGGGQTFGKRIMKIAVRNKDNEPIELWRSVIRIVLLALPSLFNQWSIPIFQNPIATWFLSLIIFGLGGAIFYTMIFNRKARQGIHDLILGTYVVHLPEKPIESFPTTPRIHWIVTSVWVGIVAIGALVMSLIASSMISKTPLAQAMSLYDILQDDPRFFTVGVNSNTFYGSNGRTSRSLIVTVWYKGRISENERQKVADSIVKIIFDNERNIGNYYDGIKVNITSAYDIGIASGNVNFWVSDSVEGWRKEIYPNGMPNGFIPLLMAKALAIP
ncbi:MAG: RDD family protein [Chloroflexi bacterium]|nr:RDD family protein [Chloroflexota bacterium]